MLEIIFEQCPTCDTHACAFAVVNGKTHCPMCAPVPDRMPHDYMPISRSMYEELRGDLSPETIATANLISGVCCGDSGDCAHECGIG